MLEALAWAGFGLIFGSFTNVLILRHATSRGLGGRSACPHCHTTLKWFELVPVLSWVVLGGRCRTCKKGISLQYPAVEALTALAFVGIGLAPIPLGIQLMSCAMAILLIAIAVYDLRHMLMPDLWVFSFAGLALLHTAILLPADASAYAIAFVAGPIIAFPLWLLWFVSRGAWMGFGDVKFALGMGWLLGILNGYIALVYAFVIGAVVGIVVLLPFDRVVKMLPFLGITRFQRGAVRFTMKSEVPFGPFLILGTCIVWFSALYSFEPALKLLEGLVLWN